MFPPPSILGFPERVSASARSPVFRSISPTQGGAERCQNAHFNQIIGNGPRRTASSSGWRRRTAGQCCRAAGPRDAASYQLARRERSVTLSNPSSGAKRGFSFPKEARLLRRPDFQKVYEEGSRVSGPFFVGVCLALEGQARARVGFAVPKALGGSVIRNRIRRRLREAVRLNLGQLGPRWNVVLQARKSVLAAAPPDLSREVGRLLSRCGTS